MRGPFARAVIACDEPGCRAMLELLSSPVPAGDGGATAERLLQFTRPTAEALGWQVALEGDPTVPPSRFDVPGMVRSYNRTDAGRDLCPLHRSKG